MTIGHWQPEELVVPSIHFEGWLSACSTAMFVMMLTHLKELALISCRNDEPAEAVLNTSHDMSNIHPGSVRPKPNHPETNKTSVKGSPKSIKSIKAIKPYSTWLLRSKASGSKQDLEADLSPQYPDAAAWKP